MPLNDTAQLSVIGTVHGQQHIHTLHFRNQDGTATTQGLIDGWQANARTAYRALFHTADSPCELYRAQVVCGSLPLPAASEEAEAAPNIVGSGTKGATERAPAWLAALVSVRTASAGKSYRGRFFIGGIYEGDFVADNLTAATIAGMTAYTNALIAAYVTPTTGTNGWRWVVHSRKLSAVPGSQCQNTSSLVTGVLVRAAVASMKSRKPGRGS